VGIHPKEMKSYTKEQISQKERAEEQMPKAGGELVDGMKILLDRRIKFQCSTEFIGRVAIVNYCVFRNH
jgi:hypothetical protein